MRLLPTAATAILAGAILLAGCGGSSSNQSAAPSSPAASTAATSTGSSSIPSSPSSHGPSSSPTPPVGSPSDAHPTEFNPPGDIPDNAVFVDHTAPGTRVHFSVPEGWAATTQGPVTTYTDKYNSISIEVRPRATASTVASARAEDVPELQHTAQNFQLQGIETVDRKHGSAVHITYLADSPPNPVTDKVVRNAVERFEFWKGGEEALLTLAGPQGADNVDPWQIVSDSLEWK
jgi:hypothetical protein